MNWFPESIIFATQHGSVCYGLATATSDLDMKGICIPPKEIENDLFHTFEQTENNPYIEERFSHLRNPRNPKIETVFYSLKKFIRLAAQVNPNIIELLFVDESDIKLISPKMVVLLQNRDLFISSKAKFTFTGYANAQLAKIERHRKWIENPVKIKPKREDFGLPESAIPGYKEVVPRIQKVIDGWTFSEFGLNDLNREEIREKCFELISSMGTRVSWDNWPSEFWHGALQKVAQETGLREEVMMAFHKENLYYTALKNHENYLRWEKDRNPERKILEEKYKYDSKHAMHLIRLLHMGLEILKEGKVYVRRPDRDFLLNIRNGGWTYEKMMEYAESKQAEIEESYKAAKIPRSVDYQKINQLYHELA